MMVCGMSLVLVRHDRPFAALKGALASLRRLRGRALFQAATSFDKCT